MISKYGGEVRERFLYCDGFSRLRDVVLRITVPDGFRGIMASHIPDGGQKRLALARVQAFAVGGPPAGRFPRVAGGTHDYITTFRSP